MTEAEYQTIRDRVMEHKLARHAERVVMETQTVEQFDTVEALIERINDHKKNV